MVEWYRGYNVQRSDDYWIGSRDGTIIETHYVDSDHVTIQNLEKFCEKHCQMTWSIAYIPTKYLGITFRFFGKEDIKMFENEKYRLEKIDHIPVW